jgi:hypothetical protein
MLRLSRKARDRLNFRNIRANNAPATQMLATARAAY